jgi:uncharacterized membrane protein
MASGAGSFYLANAGWLWPVAALFAVAAAAAVWSYRRSGRDRRLVAALGLRLLGLSLLALSLLEPSWTTWHPRPGANLFVVLADNSQSMSLRDGGEHRSRGDRLREIVRGDRGWLATLGETFRVRAYLFDQRLRRVEDLSGALTFSGPASHLGAALRTVAERYRGGPLAGVLLFSDGNATDFGDRPFEPDGLPPIYPVLMGGQSPAPDIALSQVRVTPSAFEDTPVTVEARIEATGQKGRTMTAELLDLGGKVVAHLALPVTQEHEHLTARFRLRPEAPGFSFYRARVSAEKAPEATQANNARLVVVEAPRGPLRVLYIGGRPNWEYKFLRRALENESQVELVALIRMAAREPKFVFQGRQGEATNPLFRGFGASAEEAERYDEPVLVRLGTRDEAELREGFPRSAEALYEYHAVILDDVEAGFFSADQQALLERFVTERGGGLLMLGGQDSFQQGGYDRTPIGEVLPVHLDRLPRSGPTPPVRLALSREGWLEAWTRLRENEAAERERLEAMPAFRVLSRVRALKPGATVLGTATAGDSAYPALVVQRAGEGRTGAITIGDLWRWGLRDPRLQADLGKFWRQTVRWLIADVPGRLAIRIEQGAQEGGELVIRVRGRDRAFRPADDWAVTVEVTAPDGKKTNLVAEPSAAEAGLYEARHVPRQSGAYRVLARAAAGSSGREDEGLQTDAAFALDLEADEHRSIRADAASLEAMARLTGGHMVAAEDLDSFVRAVPKRAAPISDSRSEPLWHTVPVFLLALACLLGEWTLRRSRGLA